MASASSIHEEVSCEEPSKPEEVLCDICTETKAIKTCLVCRMSYCETHLEPHLKVKKLQQHKLINAVKNLEDIMCKKHDRPVEQFCKTDHMCVCQFCTESDHKFHQTVSLAEGYEGKKAELGKTEAEVQQMIQERQKKIQGVEHSVQLSEEKADREKADSKQVFTAMISCIERSQDEVIKVIEEKHKTTEKQAEGFIKDLQQEITELKKRSSELKQLSHTEDHLHLLQNFTSINTPPPTKDWTKVNVLQPSYVGTVRKAVAQLEKTLSQDMEKYRKDLRWIQRYAVDVTLDPDTAHCILILSEDGKQVRATGVKEQKIWDKPNTFRGCPRVLGKESFSSGRFYYEVQIQINSSFLLGVVSESLKRGNRHSVEPNSCCTIFIGKNVFWARTDTNYNSDDSDDPDDPDVPPPVRENLQTMGVFVDYEEGLVSFYDMEARVHLYSFTGCTFTDKLYPIFAPNCQEDDAALIISPVNLTD